MIKDKITVNTEERQSFGKMQIALAIKNSTYKGLGTFNFQLGIGALGHLFFVVLYRK